MPRTWSLSTRFLPDISRPAPGEATAQFHGIIEDANWFADFIYQYITRTERWASPKFLIGESYGTTRSAELAGVIQERHQIYLNGIALLSSVAFSNWGADNRTIFFLPTYVTTAWYHHLSAARLAEPDCRSSGAKSAGVCAWRICAGFGKRRPAFPGGAPESGRGSRALHGALHEIY